MQLEGIALDPDAVNGIATIGAMEANNMAFTQTQATQASQVCAVHICKQELLLNTHTRCLLGWLTRTFVQAPATKLSMTEKERLLPKLAQEGWLANVPDEQGTYSIGVRALSVFAV